MSLPSPESHALYISARNHAKSVLQLAKNSFINRKCQNLSRSNSPRDFWHLANSISNNFTSSSFPPLFQPDGTTAISSISKAELFAQTFAKNSTLDDSGLVPPSPPPSDYFMLPIKIFRNDVFHALSGLNPRKAYGPDGVPPIVLRNCASVLAPCLVKLFQLCLSTSTFPSCWKFAYIQPVPKKGDHSNPSNYRPTALISCLSKVFESILIKDIRRKQSCWRVIGLFFSCPSLVVDRKFKISRVIRGFVTTPYASSHFAVQLILISNTQDNIYNKRGYKY